MYKRKFPKTKAVVENNSVQLMNTSTNSSLSVNTPNMSTIFNEINSNDNESPESPSMLEDFIDFPVEKKRKTVDMYVDESTDGGSEPLFDGDDDDTFLKQTLSSCGLHLKCDQNLLC